MNHKYRYKKHELLEEYFIAHPLIELEGVPRVVVHMD